MNNFKKIGLSALAGSLVAISAHAAEVSISGGASVAVGSGDDKAKSTYYQDDSITFTVSGETDGGLSITTSLELDGDASGGNGGDFDSQSLEIGHDTLGTVTFAAHGLHPCFLSLLNQAGILFLPQDFSSLFRRDLVDFFLHLHQEDLRIHLIMCLKTRILVVIFCLNRTYVNFI